MKYEVKKHGGTYIIREVTGKPICLCYEEQIANKILELLNSDGPI